MKKFLLLISICSLLIVVALVINDVTSIQSYSSELEGLESKNMFSTEDVKPSPPPIKIGPISMDAGAILRAALERVWVTKYFGTPAEIYKIPSNMPLCEALPKPPPKQDIKSGGFLWRDKCLPLTIEWEVNRNDLSGIGTIRMLDFDEANEVLEEAFKIIRMNDLGAYRIDNPKYAIIKNHVINIKYFHVNNPKNRDFETIFENYEDSLKTYPILEGRYILGDIPNKNLNITNDFENRAREAREYFSHRGRKYALTIDYNPAEFVKDGNIIEYSLTAPAGFFGMEKDFNKGKTE